MEKDFEKWWADAKEANSRMRYPNKDFKSEDAKAYARMWHAFTVEHEAEREAARQQMEELAGEIAGLMAKAEELAEQSGLTFVVPGRTGYRPNHIENGPEISNSWFHFLGKLGYEVGRDYSYWSESIGDGH